MKNRKRFTPVEKFTPEKKKKYSLRYKNSSYLEDIKGTKDAEIISLEPEPDAEGIKAVVDAPDHTNKCSLQKVQ